MACAIAGVAVSPQSILAPWQVLVLGLAVLLSSASAGAFNQLYESDLDANMKRTQQRPFVTGRFKADGYWISAIVLTLLIALAATTLATNAVSALYVFLGAFTYGVVYTVWLKRRTWLNIVIGGLSGSFAVLAGAAAADSSLTPSALILAGVLFLWTPPHFWALALACKKDYAAAGVPMLPVVVSEKLAVRVILAHAVVLVALSLTLGYFGMGWIYMAGAGIGGAIFIAASIKLVAKPSIAQGWRTFAASIVQLGLLLTATILDPIILG